MTPEQLKLIQQLSELGDVTIVKKTENPIDSFAHYFSKLDINGLENVLSNQNNYDGISKEEYLILIEKEFISLKNNGIHSLKAIPGVCDGCEKGCSGFTFLDEKDGYFMDFILKIEDSEIVNFMECYNFKNDVEIPNKLEHILVKPFSLYTDNNEFPF
ncbi:MAG: hypothetical protein RL308_807 [Bacteroidota bacterium]|jgi:hypothetical protein